MEAKSSDLLIAATAGATSLVALVITVNLLDFGMQSGQVANQTRIFGLGEQIRGRLNTLYMVTTFAGGAAGAFAGGAAWMAGGWQGVCLLSLGLAAAAGLVLGASVLVRRPPAAQVA